MCSPDLTYGLCGICLGSLTDDTIYVDEHGDSWDHHKGVCAYMAGEVAPEHQQKHDELIAAIRSAADGAETFEARRAYYVWLQSLGLEDHFHDLDNIPSN